ncbi:MAG: hypothetical protein IPJ32_12760 [Sphingobacteriaceae bacterium]|nr:hypothetical protein [Sphingobacteriaceae bacterium]
MKKIITLSLLLTILFFTSCKKKSTEPIPSTATTVASEDIKVQYRVTSASGHFNVEYVSFEDDKITTTKKDVGSITFTYSFYWVPKQKLSISAINSTPSNKEIKVEIYVNGVLFKSGEAKAVGAVALAEGVYTN